MPAHSSTALAQAFRCPFCRLHRGPGLGEELCNCSERKKNETPEHQQSIAGDEEPLAPIRGRGQGHLMTPELDDGGASSPLITRSTGMLSGLFTPQQTQEEEEGTFFIDSADSPFSSPEISPFRHNSADAPEVEPTNNADFQNHRRHLEMQHHIRLQQIETMEDLGALSTRLRTRARVIEATGKHERAKQERMRKGNRRLSLVLGTVVLLLVVYVLWCWWNADAFAYILRRRGEVLRE